MTYPTKREKMNHHLQKCLAIEDIPKNPFVCPFGRDYIYLKSNFFEDGIGTQNILFDRELSGFLLRGSGYLVTGYM